MSASIPPDLNIFDENENIIDAEHIVGEKTNILCILEFEGIKCGLSSFQIQVKVRQMMTIKPIFSKCLIKKNTVDDGGVASVSGGGMSGRSLGNNVPPSAPPSATTTPTSSTTAPPSNQPLPFNETNVGGGEGEVGLIETEIVVNDDDDEGDANVMKIKERGQIIMELYASSVEKAKHAKILAIMAYLEKNEIKNTYMMEDAESDDDDDIFGELIERNYNKIYNSGK
jgi:hypothetical protein